ncbi:MAG: carboxypeptidase-like regulatory domain-containing protein [Bacteroidales bacterium]|nr:carboxypeptidase-like regulatory domain-containing protein [Bacteroidales bacterium]
MKKKIYILFVFAFLLHLSVFAQNNLLQKRLVLTKTEGTIFEILKEIGDNGNFYFSYSNDIPVKQNVKLKTNNKTVKEFLDEIFIELPINYTEIGNKIILSVKKESKNQLQLKQTIKGKVIDIDSKKPLVGANIILDSDKFHLGTISDTEGNFKFENIPIGRHNLSFSYVGFKYRTINNVLINSGKEYVIDVELEESVVNLNEVKIISSPNKSRPINNLAVISARSFSADEINNYPGSISDISRTALSFPGVLSSNDGQNHIIIRGNSPKGLQWRLEGIEIPNLNHFAEIGASGGGVNIISNNMIASSDFLTSAFPSEYGNALSGIFDLRLRTGNNEKHEQTFQIGLLGTEIMVEGPIKKESNTTYIAQYRYSTLRLAQGLGFDLESVPDFQDISFKIYHPTKKLGTFSIFGIGGLSHEEGESGYIMNSNMATLGISNFFSLNSTTFLKTVISLSGWHYTWDEKSFTGTMDSPIDRLWNTNVTEYTTKASVSINKKINTKHKLKAGIIYGKTFNNSYMGWSSDTLKKWYLDPENPNYGNLVYDHSYVDANANAGTLQAYLNWKYKITNGLTFNSGVHFLQFYLNDNYSIEPRLGIHWQINPKHSLSAGFGIHSRKESMTLYIGKLTLHDGTDVQANIDLELTKAKHYVAGYNYQITKNMLLSTEVFYQELYDIPAYPFPPYFSTINFDYGFEGNILVNYGTGYNKGVELTLEKFFANNYHFLITGTLYDSKYKNKLGEELHTKYDGTYATSAIFGKEFNVGKNKQNLIGLSTRMILMGGMRNLPYDKEASIENGYEVVIWDNGFTEKASDYFRIDLKLSFTKNKPKYSSEWSIDIINLTNRQNMRREEWDSSIRNFKIEYQNPLIPLLSYRVYF